MKNAARRLRISLNSSPRRKPLALKYWKSVLKKLKKRKPPSLLRRRKSTLLSL
jgi:hypothetical protein